MPRREDNRRGIEVNNKEHGQKIIACFFYFYNDALFWFFCFHV